LHTPVLLFFRFRSHEKIAGATNLLRVVRHDRNAGSSDHQRRFCKIARIIVALSFRNTEVFN
jgi:hypothetical protein